MPRNLSPMLAALNKYPHVPMGIWGAPGEGKTTLAAQLFATVPAIAIYLNWQLEHAVSRYANRHCNGFESVWKALKEWKGPEVPRIEWIPDARKRDASEVYRACNLLYEARVRHKDDPRRIVLFFDEVHQYSERRSPVQTLFQQGRRFRIQPVAITQFPATLQNTAVIGALNGGFAFVFLPDSQWANIYANYKIRPPEWVTGNLKVTPEQRTAYCGRGSYRAAFCDHKQWWPLDGQPDTRQEVRDDGPVVGPGNPNSAPQAARAGPVETGARSGGLNARPGAADGEGAQARGARRPGTAGSGDAPPRADGQDAGAH